MRVLILTHYYPPEAGAPQTRLAEVAAGLVRRGHQVTVHTAPPHYPAGRILPPYRNRLVQSETGADGVRVVRSAVYATPNRGVARRLLNHVSHATSALATAPAAGPADAVVVETPPLFTAASGALYARAKRAPLILNVSDLWPETAVALGMLSNERAIAAADRLARWCYRASATIVVPTDGMRERLDAMPEAAGKAVRLAPAVAVERFPPAPLPPHGPLRLAYAGTLGLSQGVATLIAAAALAGPETVQVALAGGGAELPLAEAEAHRAGAGNVRFLGTLPREEVPGLYAGHHAGAVILRDRPLFEAALPTKMFEVMAAGRAVVVAARGDAADLVRRAGAGVVVAPEDPAALAGALRELAGDPEGVARMGAAARAYVEAHHDREAMVDRWEDVLTAARAARQPSL